VKRLGIYKYSAYFVFFIFLFYLEDAVGIRPFAVAFFMALVYCKQNILILIPLYICAAMIAAPNIPMLIIASAPAAVIAPALFIHYKARIKLKLVAINFYTFLASLPQVFFSVDSTSEIADAVIGILGAQICLYGAVIALYAILVKRLKFRMNTEEVIAFSAIAAILGAGFAAINIYWYTPYYTALAVTVLLSMFIDGKTALIVSAAYGIGGAIITGQPEVLALSVIYGLLCMAFTKNSQYFAGIAVLAADTIFRAFFVSSAPFSYFSLISPAVGVVIVFCVPNKIKERLSIFGRCFAERHTARTLVNRDRRQVAEKLKMLSGVFSEIQDILYIENREKEESANIELLTREVTARCCKNCISLEGCREALGTDTDLIVSDLVIAALEQGKATILDTPPFLSSRCRKINGLITAANDAVEAFLEGEKSKASIDEGRAMVGGQMGGVAKILTELQREVECPLSYDVGTESKLIEELNAVNIGATEAVIYKGERSQVSAMLTIPEADYGKIEIEEALNRIMGTQMQLAKAEKTVGATLALHFEKAPVYKVVYGERDIAREGNSTSGDRHSGIRIARDKVMLILSDGMGSGRGASLNSGYAISLIESFYRAGFDYKTIFSSVGKLLSLREREEFNAIDIVVIDTSSGYADFIKLGGRESFIVTGGGVEVIECGSLPLGIIEDAVPLIENKKLSSGSFIVMVSDGVIDVIGRETLTELLSGISTNNPDTVAEIVIKETARLSGGRDDASVLAARIFKEAAR